MTFETVEDLGKMDLGTAIWVASITVCVTSILVLIGRVIFSSDKKKSTVKLVEEPDVNNTNVESEEN